MFSVADADELIQNTGADGVAVARAAMYDPFIFCALARVPVPDKKQAIRTQLLRTREVFGERFATVFMRKMIAFYIKGMPSSSAVKQALLMCGSVEEVEGILSGINFN